ncbi:MAG: hypothetical protein AAF368_08290, partial [Planctomycetota bacterium]
FGWALILAGFLSGALLGLGFHRADFLGGYGSLRRRMLRLGHIACVALGGMNLAYAISPVGEAFSALGSSAFFVGSITMPLVCWLTAWKQPWRHAFPVPVVALAIGALSAILGGFS